MAGDPSREGERTNAVEPDPPVTGLGRPPGPAPAANTARPLHAARPALPAVGGDEGHGFGAVLRRRDFRLLWAAQAASQLADKFLMFTLLVVVYHLSGRASEQSLLMIAYTLPSVLLSAPAGVYADRHDKRALMVATNVIRGGLILLIPLSQHLPGLAHSTWPLLLVTLVFSAVGQVFAPAEAASIPLLVGRAQIMSATSLFMTTVIMTLVAGVPTATLCLRLFGEQAPFYIAVALFAIAALCVGGVRTRLQAAGAEHVSVPEGNLLRELREGLVVLGTTPVLRLAMIELTVALVVVFTVFTLGPAYLVTVLHHPAEDTYLVLLPATVGMVAMAIALGQQHGRISRTRSLVTSTALVGGVLIALGLLPGGLAATGAGGVLVPLTLVLSAVFGAALGLLLIPAFAMLQENTTEETRGRIFGGIFTIINASVAVPVLLAGGLADAFGVDRVVAGLGGLMLAGSVVAGTRMRRRLSVLEAPPHLD